MLDAESAGVDAEVSATPAALAQIIRMAADARQALGHGRKACMPAEAVNVRASRRSLYALTSLAAGEVVTEDAVVALRPADGLDASRWQELIGVRLTREVRAGSVFVDSDIEAHHEARTPVHVA